MNLEVGMYVRLNCNYELGIGKTIREIDEDNFIKTKFKDDFECSLPTYMITKASHNIIDLIEVGDYVNGYKVSFKGNDYQPFVQCDYPVEEGSTNHYRFYEKAIYSIVTKEAFESMSYKLGDDK